MRAPVSAPSGAKIRAGSHSAIAATLSAGETVTYEAAPSRHQYLVAILSDGALLRAETLRFADELRTPADVGLPKPAKWFSVGPFFRAERPQKGRYRQFHQFGCEAIGSEEPRADAEVIALMMAIYRAFGVSDMRLRLNSLGDEQSRPRYTDALRAYLEPFRSDLSETSRQRGIHEAGFHPETYFDSSTIIIGLILMGRYLEGRAKATGTEVKVPFVHVWRLRRGKVRRGQALTDTALEELQALIAAEALVAHLSDTEREAVWGHVVEDRPYADLATEAGVEAATIRKRASSGLARLRKAGA